MQSASVSTDMSLKPEQLEPLTKSAQSANLLVQDLRAAHTAACDDQPALEILLRTLLGEAAGLEQRLAELQSRCSE